MNDQMWLVGRTSDHGRTSEDDRSWAAVRIGFQNHGWKVDGRSRCGCSCHGDHSLSDDGHQIEGRRFAIDGHPASRLRELGSETTGCSRDAVARSDKIVTAEQDAERRDKYRRGTR